MWENRAHQPRRFSLGGTERGAGKEKRESESHLLCLCSAWCEGCLVGSAGVIWEHRTQRTTWAPAGNRSRVLHPEQITSRVATFDMAPARSVFAT